MELLDQVIGFADSHAGEWAWRLLAALASLAGAWLLARFIKSALRRTMGSDKSARTRTLLPLVQALTSAVLLGTGAVMGLELLGFDLTAVIAGAGVIGLAVGFGAQELVKDVIAGFFLIFDEVLESGDWVEVDTVSGYVEEVGLRMTKIRGFDGKLWYVPNGQIKTVGNTHRGWMRAVVLVGLAYEGDLARGMKVLEEVGKAWASEHEDIVLEAPEVQGVLGLDASSLGVRLIVKVEPGQHWPAERALRVRIKEAFDREGIEIPFNRQVVYLRPDGEATEAPAQAS